MTAVMPAGVETARDLVGPAPGGGLFFHGRRRIVDRIGDAVAFGAAVIVDQQIARHAGHPCGECALR